LTRFKRGKASAKGGGKLVAPKKKGKKRTTGKQRELMDYVKIGVSISRGEWGCKNITAALW